MRGSGRPAIFLLVVIAVFICHSGPSFADTRTIEGIVVNVADGDTITVLDSNKEQHRVWHRRNRRSRKGTAVWKRFQETARRAGGTERSARRVPEVRPLWADRGKSLGEAARLSYLRQDAGRRPCTDHVRHGLVVSELRQ